LLWCHLRLADDEDAELTTLATGLGVSRSEYARDAVQVYRLLTLAILRTSERPPTAERLRAILTREAERLNKRALRGRLHQERHPQ
jgi:hypothetical protein